MPDVSSLDCIHGPNLNDVSTEPSQETRKEEEDLESQAASVQLKGLNQDIEERKVYASRAFWLCVSCLSALCVIIVLVGFKVMSLPENVLIALISGTIANVLGIFFIVIKYLFHHPK